MNPMAHHPSETVPMQGIRFGEPPVQTTVVQYTTTINGGNDPKDHIIWSLCCLIYGNPCCLGLAALIHSVKARDRKVVRDLEGARQHGSTARCFNIISTVLVCLGVFIFIVVIIVVSTQVHSAYSNRYHYGRDYGYG